MHKSLKTIIFILLIGIGIIAIIATLLKNQKKALSSIYKPDIEAIVVNVQKAIPSRLEVKLSYVGYFLPNRTIDIVPQIAGNVLKIYFQEGDRVQKDSVLVQIDDETLEAQILGAKATLDNAQMNYERYKNATDKNGISQSQLDQYYVNVQTAKAQYLQLKKQISNCKIIAPFSGFITDKNIDEGAFVSNTTKIAKLTDINKLKLQITVPENEINYFRDGQRIRVVIPAFNNFVVQGIVNYVSTVADESHNFIVKLMVNNPQYKIKAGMYANAYMDQTSLRTGFVFKRSALLGSTINPQVYLVNPKDSTVYLKNVVLGDYNADNIEIINGIKEGDIVVTNGQINLKENTKVRIFQ